MEENKIYPEQPEGQNEDPVQDSVPGDVVQGVQPGALADLGETNVSQTEDDPNAIGQPAGLLQNGGQIDQNPVPQSQDHQGSSYQNNDYRNNGYQNQDYQGNGYPSNHYQSGGYQNNTYQSGGYPAYRNGDYQTGSYQSGNYQNSGYQGSGYQNRTYSAHACQSYGTDYQQYNTAASYPNSQMELEEPVRISEWVLAMVLMTIPCVNIIMMFVWAFSSTEKKSKSNFFKAYLIFFGIFMGVMLLVWLAVLIFAMML